MLMHIHIHLFIHCFFHLSLICPSHMPFLTTGLPQQERTQTGPAADYLNSQNKTWVSSSTNYQLDDLGQISSYLCTFFFFSIFSFINKVGMSNPSTSQDYLETHRVNTDLLISWSTQALHGLRCTLYLCGFLLSPRNLYPSRAFRRLK